MMDNGYPQTTEFKILKDFIKTETHELNVEKKKKSDDNGAQAVTCISSAVPWRQPGIKYKKNEVFLDVIEKLNMLIGPQSNVIKSEIIG